MATSKKSVGRVAAAVASVAVVAVAVGGLLVLASGEDAPAPAPARKAGVARAAASVRGGQSLADGSAPRLEAKAPAGARPATLAAGPSLEAAPSAAGAPARATHAELRAREAASLTGREASPAARATSPSEAAAPAVDGNAASPEDAREAQRLALDVLTDLKAKDAPTRIAALKLARDLAVPGVQGAIERVALGDDDPLVRRFAVQALALDDRCAEHRDAFVALLSSTDWAIRANAQIGLARSGDEGAQGDLLDLLARLRAEGSPHADSIARAVEAPELRGERILEHYRRLAGDPLASRDARGRAQDVLAAKQAGL